MSKTPLPRMSDNEPLRENYSNDQIGQNEYLQDIQEWKERNKEQIAEQRKMWGEILQNMTQNFMQFGSRDVVINEAMKRFTLIRK